MVVILAILDDERNPDIMVPTVGHAREEKAKNHDRIVEIAAARIRESGTVTPGVAEIMNSAGLTHGGFYKHFASRDELVAEAVDRALADGDEAMRSVSDGADDPLAAFVDWYTSAEHRDNPADGCAVVALGSEVPRADGRVRTAYREQVERYLAHLEQLHGGGEDARRRAIASLTSLVGAVLVARAVDDTALSDEILNTVRETVTTP